MRSVFCILMLTMSLASYAQNKDTLKKLYINETIYRYGKNFMKGTERLRFADLGREFNFSSVGITTYQQAKRNRNTSLVLKLLSTAAGVAAISFAARGNFNRTLFALGGQVALAIGGGVYQRQSDKLLDKALWQRNKDLLFR